MLRLSCLELRNHVAGQGAHANNTLNFGEVYNSKEL